MAAASKTRYVDVSNPSLAVDCPHCGLRTARFVDHCRNCGYKLWPSSQMASAAFRAWKAVDPDRATASRFDLEIPRYVDNSFDFGARAHELGIHLFPNSNWPFIICLGLLFLGLAAIPFSSVARIILAAAGGLIFVYGIAGWVLFEDVHMFPSDQAPPGAEAHH